MYSFFPLLPLPLAGKLLRLYLHLVSEHLTFSPSVFTSGVEYLGLVSSLDLRRLPSFHTVNRLHPHLLRPLLTSGREVQNFFTRPLQVSFPAILSIAVVSTLSSLTVHRLRFDVQPHLLDNASYTPYRECNPCNTCSSVQTFAYGLLQTCSHPQRPCLLLLHPTV